MRVVVLAALALVAASAPASVSHAEPEGATPGSGRGAAAVITAGGFHSCAVLENGTVRCWGDNDAGQLGYGDTDDRGDNAGEMGDNLAPIDLGAGRTATAIAAGSSHSCAVLDNGAVKCWGDNDVGQLGYGDLDDRGDNAGEMGDNLATDRPRCRSHRHSDRRRGRSHVCAARQRHREMLGGQRCRPARPGRHRLPG